MNRYDIYDRTFNKLERLTVQKYERYLPTAFDESLSLLEKINRVINSMNVAMEEINQFAGDVDQGMMNTIKELENMYDRIKDFEESVENDLLPDSTLNILSEWLDDGTLSDLINSDVFDMKTSKSDVPVNIQDYKEYRFGDDWKPAIDRALSESYHVYFPRGVYQSSEVDVPDNAKISGDGNDTVFFPLQSTLFNIEGTIEEEIKIVSDNIDFSKMLYLENNSGLNPGDDILLKSQRDALNETDAGESYTMGTQTGNFTAYLGEYQTIHQVFDDYIELDDHVQFPVYYHHDNNETSGYARPSTTIQKINFKRDITLKDFRVEKIVSSTINVVYGKNIVVDGVTLIDSEYDGTTGRVKFINFERSRDCVARNCHFSFRYQVHPSTYYWTNVYYITSSTNCGFDHCYSRYAGQTFDLTFSRDGIISNKCYVTNCTDDYAITSSVSLHGGLFHTKVADNTITGVAQGVSIRGRNALVTNNVLKGTTPRATGEGNAGIRVYDKWAVDCIVSNNTISNFRSGISVLDSNDHEFGYIGLLATNNVIKDCMTGVRMWTNWNNLNMVNRNVNISNNIIIASDVNDGSVYGVYVRRYNKGVTVMNNNITHIGSNTGSGIHFTADCPDAVIKDNIITNFSLGIRYPYLENLSLYPLNTFRMILMSNVIIGETETDELDERIRINISDIHSGIQLQKVDRQHVDIPRGTVYIGVNGFLRYKDWDGEVRSITAPVME